MRRIGTILFLSLYLFSYTEFHQIFSLPALVDHFYEHRVENSGIGLVEFIGLHYSNAEHRHTSSGHHELPFKEDHCLQTLTMNPIYFTEITLKEFLTVAEIERHNSLYTSGIVTWQLHYSIWQPPRA